MVRQSKYPQKILFTYVCRQCRKCVAHVFTDGQCPCPYCGNDSMIMPNTRLGVDEQQLATIYNAMDCYVQYAICEGFGMPAVEAAACNVPVFATDYSAMNSVVNNLGGIPIPVKRFFREAETHAYRAYPNNDVLVEELLKFLVLPEQVRKSRYPSRKNCMKNYSWDKVASTWMNIIDTMFSADEPWHSPPSIINAQRELVKTGIPNNDFVALCQKYIVKDLLKNNSVKYIMLRKLKQLNEGGIAHGAKNNMFSPASYLGTIPNLQPYDQQKCIQECIDIVDNYNFWERNRTQGYTKPYFLQMVKPDDKEL